MGSEILRVGPLISFAEIPGPTLARRIPKIRTKLESVKIIGCFNASSSPESSQRHFVNIRWDSIWPYVVGILRSD